MFDRGNVVGLLLLGLCLAAGAVMLYAITTGTTFTYTGPGWLVPILMVLFLGGVLYGLASGRRGRWPDPLTGRRGWRRWLRRDRDQHDGP